MAVIEADYKIKEYKGELNTVQHTAKQKGLPKWRKYTKNKNPDLAILKDNRLAVRLDAIVKLQKAQEASTDVGADIYDDSGKYWGVL